MDINELMIGDWMKVTRTAGDGRTSTEVKRLEYSDFECAHFYPEHIIIEPIPITPEFLIKNGFIIDDYVPVNKFWMLKNDKNVNGSIIFTHKIMDSGYPVDKRSGYCIGPLGMVDLKNMLYVHEMQHGLRVVGNNKELVV